MLECIIAMMMIQPRHPALHLEEVVPQLGLRLGGQVLLQAEVRHDALKIFFS